MTPWRNARALALRLLHVFDRKRASHFQQSFTDEIEAHLQLHIEDNLRAGMSPQAARRDAMLRLGGIEMTKQSYRERETLPWADDLIHDLSFAMRQLRRNAGFTITAVLMLSLGMGASVAIFAFVHAALLKPLPYPNPSRLVSVTETVKLFGRANLSYLDYLDWKRMNHAVESIEIYGGGGGLLNTPTGTLPVSTLRVSDGFFRTLRVAPMMGRDFYPGEDLAGSTNTVILSDGAWHKWFQARPDVIGQKVLIDGLPNVVVGVMPKGFSFALRGATEFWMPFHPKGECDLRRSCHNLMGIARLKDGESIQAARAEMTGIASQLERQYPGDNRGQGASVESLSEIAVGDIRKILLMLLGGSGLLLIIACVNVASLLMIRSESRMREIAVRRSLGASTTRIVRQFITEAILLVLLGGVLGLGVAAAAIRVMLSLIPKEMLEGMPFLNGLHLSGPVLAFASGVSILAVIVFSLTPTLRLRFTGLRDGLAEGSRGSAGTVWRKLGSNLVVLELAIAVVLLGGAGLLSKSLYKLLHVGVNFNPDRIALVNVSAPDSLYPKDEDRTALQKKLLSRIAALPGVQHVGMTSVAPVSYNGNTDWIRFVGRPYNGIHNEVNSRDVTSDFFKTLEAKMVKGRQFTEDDDFGKPKVAIINKTLAKMYYPDQDPVGQRFGNTVLDPKSIKEIVGVVDDIKEGSLDSEIWPAAYYPMYQDEDDYFAVMVRTSQSEASILPLLVSTIHSIDPGLGTVGQSTMTQYINESSTVYIHRSSAWLVSGFALLALMLSVAGLYGVIAYSVSQRTREIGVRMALGAQRSSVTRLVMREAGRLTLFGISVGSLASIGVATLIRNLLFGADAWDMWTLAGVASLLGALSMLASYIPAHRAAGVNPVEALRSE